MTHADQAWLDELFTDGPAPERPVEQPVNTAAPGDVLGIVFVPDMDSYEGPFLDSAATYEYIMALDRGTETTIGVYMPDGLGRAPLGTTREIPAAFWLISWDCPGCGSGGAEIMFNETALANFRKSLGHANIEVCKYVLSNAAEIVVP